MRARIYQPARNAMQSGTAKTRSWVLEFAPASAREIDPLMGWTSSADTRAQLHLHFDTLEEAVAYAQKQGLMYSVERPHERKVKPKAYADNFKYDRLGRWTH